MMSPSTSLRARRYLPLLPLLGFVAYIPEAATGHPNLIWTCILLAWTVIAMAFTWWLLQPQSEWLVRAIDLNATRLAVALMGAAAVILLAGSFYQARYFTAGPQAEDTAYYSQVLWNTVHGNFLSGNVQQERLYNPPVTSDLALHVSPVLLLVLAPAYAVFPHFLTLLVLRDLALVAAAWPLFLLARELLGGAGGVAAVLLYLANPVIIGQGTDAFYLLQLAPLPFFWAFRAFVKREFGSFLLWMGAILAAREDAAIACAGFGLLALLQRRPFKWWCFGLGIPIFWWGLVTEVIQPAFGGWRSGGFQVALTGGGTSLLGTYTVLLTHPSWIVGVLRQGGLRFIYKLFRSVGFLALLGTEAVLAVPALAAILFLHRVLYSALDPVSHLVLLPWCALVGTTVVVVNRLGRKYKWDLRVFSVILLLLVPSASLVDGLKNAVQIRQSTSVRNDPEALREAIRLVPSNASIAASNYALPALSKRYKLYYLQYIREPVANQKGGEVGAPEGGKGRWSGGYPHPHPDYILLDYNLDRITTNPGLRKRYMALLEELSHPTEYKVMWQKGDYSLLQRNPSTSRITMPQRPAVVWPSSTISRH